MHAQESGEYGEDGGQERDPEGAAGRRPAACYAHVVPPSELLSRVSGYRCSTLEPGIVFRLPEQTVT